MTDERFGLCPDPRPEAQAIWEEMKSGCPYDAANRYLTDMLMAVRVKTRRFNDCRPDDRAGLDAAIRDILGGCGERIQVNQPFRCDYGVNIRVGEDFFANFNLTVLDEGEVVIGDNAFIGPNVSIYTACHPVEPEERNRLVEWSMPVTIGHNVWIGGSVTILPGVTIGDDCVIGAGSVVTRDIPAGSVAVGNPCRVIRRVKSEAPSAKSQESRVKGEE